MKSIGFTCRRTKYSQRQWKLSSKNTAGVRGTQLPGIRIHRIGILRAACHYHYAKALYEIDDKIGTQRIPNCATEGTVSSRYPPYESGIFHARSALSSFQQLRYKISFLPDHSEEDNTRISPENDDWVALYNMYLSESLRPEGPLGNFIRYAVRWERSKQTAIVKSSSSGTHSTWSKSWSSVSHRYGTTYSHGSISGAAGVRYSDLMDLVPG